MFKQKRYRNKFSGKPHKLPFYKQKKPQKTTWRKTNKQTNVISIYLNTLNINPKINIKSKTNVLFYLICLILILTNALSESKKNMQWKLNSQTCFPDSIPDNILKAMPSTLRDIVEETYVNGTASVKQDMQIIAMAHNFMQIEYHDGIPTKFIDTVLKHRKLNEATTYRESGKLTKLGIIFHPVYHRLHRSYKCATVIHEFEHLKNQICNAKKGGGGPNPYTNSTEQLQFEKARDDFLKNLKTIVANIVSNNTKPHLSVLKKFTQTCPTIYRTLKLPVWVTAKLLKDLKAAGYTGRIALSIPGFNNYLMPIRFIRSTIEKHPNYVEYHFSPKTKAQKFLVNAFELLMAEENRRGSKKYNSQLSAFIAESFPDNNVVNMISPTLAKYRDKFTNDCYNILSKT